MFGVFDQCRVGHTVWGTQARRAGTCCSIITCMSFQIKTIYPAASLSIVQHQFQFDLPLFLIKHLFHFSTNQPFKASILTIWRMVELRSRWSSVQTLSLAPIQSLPLPTLFNSTQLLTFPQTFTFPTLLNSTQHFHFSTNFPQLHNFSLPHLYNSFHILSIVVAIRNFSFFSLRALFRLKRAPIVPIVPLPTHPSHYSSSHYTLCPHYTLHIVPTHTPFPLHIPIIFHWKATVLTKSWKKFAGSLIGVRQVGETLQE